MNPCVLKALMMKQGMQNTEQEFREDWDFGLSIRKSYSLGQREGLLAGKQSVMQKAFDEGFKRGAIAAFEGMNRESIKDTLLTNLNDDLKDLIAFCNIENLNACRK